MIQGRAESEKPVLIPKFTTVHASAHPAISFETTRDATFQANRIVRCVSQYHDLFTDHTLDLNERGSIYQKIQEITPPHLSP